MTVVRRSVVLNVDKLIPPAALSKLLADGARQARDAAIASGEAPPSFNTAGCPAAGGGLQRIRRLRRQSVPPLYRRRPSTRRHRPGRHMRAAGQSQGRRRPCRGGGAPDGATASASAQARRLACQAQARPTPCFACPG